MPGVSRALLRASSAVLVTGSVLGACGFEQDGASAPDGAFALVPNATLVRVVDGDTVVVDINGTEERVRLIGIDTPESVAPGRPVECFGREASDRLDELVPPGTFLYLERDIEPRDMYERLLAYVYRADDGLHLNLDQVERGYAAAMSYPPNTTFEADFAAAEAAARAALVGLWEVCGGPDVPIAPPPVDSG